MQQERTERLRLLSESLDEVLGELRQAGREAGELGGSEGEEALERLEALLGSLQALAAEVRQRSGDKGGRDG